MSFSEYDYLLKFIIVGDAGVGKTCILGRFVADEDWSPKGATIGVDFGVKVCRLDHRRLKLHLWDTAGQESFRSITRSYYRGCAAVILVYDVTCRASFEHVQKWRDEVLMHASTSPVLLLLGNKTDLGTNRVVSLSEGLHLAETLGALFCEASAKTESSSVLQTGFLQAAQEVLDRLDRGMELPGAQRGLKASPPATSRLRYATGCC